MKRSTKLLAFLIVICSLVAYSLIFAKTDKLTEQRYSFGDTIVGNFNGSIDTLVALPIDTIPADYDPKNVYAGHHYVWRVKSLNGTVSDLTFKNTIGVKMVAEGDLDGDGYDEFGYVIQWPTSDWTHYKLLTFKDGQWGLLIFPTSLWLSHIEAGNDLYNPEGLTERDIAWPTGEKGTFHIRYSIYREKVDDSGFLFVDTIVATKFQPIIEEK